MSLFKTWANARGAQRCICISAHAVMGPANSLIYRNKLETVSFQRLTRGPSSTCLPSEWLVSAKIGFLRVIGSLLRSVLLGSPKHTAVKSAKLAVIYCSWWHRWKKRASLTYHAIPLSSPPLHSLLSSFLIVSFPCYQTVFKAGTAPLSPAFLSSFKFVTCVQVYYCRYRWELQKKARDTTRWRRENERYLELRINHGQFLYGTKRYLLLLFPLFDVDWD